MLDSLKGNIKIPEISINELFERNANINKSQPMVIFNGKFISYYRFLGYINSMASKLYDTFKVNNDFTIAVLLENGPEFIISIMAILRIGCRVLILNKKDLDNKNFNTILTKLNIKNMIVSKKFYNLIEKYINIKFIISDNNEFLTIGNAIKRSLKNRIKIKYNENTMKFSDFIYNNKNFNEIKFLDGPRIIFLNNDEIVGFTEKNLIPSTIILNYWLPKLDKRPYFFSAIDMYNPIGMVYSILLPISFSGALIYGDINILNKIDVDFLIGNCSFFDKLFQKKVYLEKSSYFVSPNFNLKLYNKVLKETGKKMICGYSNELLLTTHLNPFEDIREGSIGVPLSNVQYRIAENGEMAIKSDQSVSYIYGENEFIRYPEWVNTHLKVKIIDGYFYPGQQDISH